MNINYQLYSLRIALKILTSRGCINGVRRPIDPVSEMFEQISVDQSLGQLAAERLMDGFLSAYRLKQQIVQYRKIEMQVLRNNVHGYSKWVVT